MIGVGVVAALVGGIIGWAIGRSTSPDNLSSEGRAQMQSYQGRVDDTLGSIIQPLGEGESTSFIAFAQLLADSGAFREGDLKPEDFKGTAQNVIAAAQEARSGLETIPLGDMIDKLPQDLGPQIGFVTIQLKDSLALFEQAANLYVLASDAETEGDLTLADSLLGQADQLRALADTIFRDAFTEYNAALSFAGLTPTWEGQAAGAVPVGG
jgi:hypothetical protein